MNIITTPLGKRLQLRLNLGLDEDLNPIYRLRSWSNVKPEVSDANLMILANHLGGLTEHAVNRVQTVDTTELEEE